MLLETLFCKLKVITENFYCVCLLLLFNSIIYSGKYWYGNIALFIITVNRFRKPCIVVLVVYNIIISYNMSDTFLQKCWQKTNTTYYIIFVGMLFIIVYYICTIYVLRKHNVLEYLLYIYVILYYWRHVCVNSYITYVDPIVTWLEIKRRPRVQV